MTEEELLEGLIETLDSVRQTEPDLKTLKLLQLQLFTYLETVNQNISILKGDE
jgi:hypothetical protein